MPHGPLRFQRRSRMLSAASLAIPPYILLMYGNALQLLSRCKIIKKETQEKAILNGI